MIISAVARSSCTGSGESGRHPIGPTVTKISPSSSSQAATLRGKESDKASNERRQSPDLLDHQGKHPVKASSQVAASRLHPSANINHGEGHCAQLRVSAVVVSCVGRSCSSP